MIDSVTKGRGSKISKCAWCNQGPRIDFQSEGTKIVFYLILPEAPPCWTPEGKISHFGSLGLKKMQSVPRCIPRRVPRRISREFCFCTTNGFWSAQNWRGQGSPDPPVAWALVMFKRYHTL